MPQENGVATNTLVCATGIVLRGMLVRYMAYDAALDFVDEIVSVEETFVGGSWAVKENFTGVFRASQGASRGGAQRRNNQSDQCLQPVRR